MTRNEVNEINEACSKKGGSPPLPFKNPYNLFIQRFKILFNQEVECEHSESTVNNILAMLEKCGLSELLDENKNQNPPPPPQRSRTATAPDRLKRGRPSAAAAAADSPNTRRSDLQSSGEEGKPKKALSGYNLFMRETIRNDRTMDFKSCAEEWRQLTRDEKADYNLRAKELFESQK